MPPYLHIYLDLHDYHFRLETVQKFSVLNRKCRKLLAEWYNTQGTAPYVNLYKNFFYYFMFILHNYLLLLSSMFIKIKFSVRCSHLIRSHPTHQIFNRELQSRFPMEKLFRKSTAGSVHLFPAAWVEDT